MKTTKSNFADFTSAELRAFINGCHASRDYTEQFRAATDELNNRDGKQEDRELVVYFMGKRIGAIKS